MTSVVFPSFMTFDEVLNIKILLRYVKTVKIPSLYSRYGVSCKICTFLRITVGLDYHPGFNCTKIIKLPNYCNNAYKHTIFPLMIFLSFIIMVPHNDCL
jgi:hypothetical protein